MEWFNKEVRFSEAYSSGKTCRNLWRYIPKKLHIAVADCNTDFDGYWIWLDEGWSAYDHGSDCGTIHEYNIKDLKEAIKTISKTQ